MIFLILKIFVYLLLALAAGVGAGWLLRHMMAARQEEDMQRTLADARARVPQFESLIRSRDEQIKRLKEELKEKDVRINGLVDDVREAEFSLKDKDRELKAFTARQETLVDGDTLEIGEASDSGAAAEMRTRIAGLEAELKTAHAQAADAMAEAAAAEAEVITLKAEMARMEKARKDSERQDPAELDEASEDNSQTLAELEARLTQKTQEHDRLARSLEAEQRRVVELERERELQNKSLRVLHQQLELARERGQRAAAG